MTCFFVNKIPNCILRPMARSYIEVGYRAGSEDPLGHFVSLLREKHDSSTEIEEYNCRLLGNLIKRGKIPKSSIIWHQDKIIKIYGFKVDKDGKIEYDLVGNNSPDRRTKQYVSNSPHIDMSAVRNAIIRSKQAVM